MEYPGRVIKLGEDDRMVIKAVHDRLEQLGYTEEKLSSLGFSGQFSDQVYDETFKGVVKLFQSQHVDDAGGPLKADGQLGPLTWVSLFGPDSMVAARPADGLPLAALTIAEGQVGVRERPVGSNRGPEVNEYLASVGLKPGLFWCMAFVYFCYQRASEAREVANSFPKTGGVLDAWSKAKRMRILRADAVKNPSLLLPGSVFIIDHGGGLGHAGFVKSCNGGALATIEGNSNDDGSSNGIGVFSLNRRNIMNKDIKGFITPV